MMETHWPRPMTRPLRVLSYDCFCNFSFTDARGSSRTLHRSDILFRCCCYLRRQATIKENGEIAMSDVRTNETLDFNGFIMQMRLQVNTQHYGSAACNMYFSRLLPSDAHNHKPITAQLPANVSALRSQYWQDQR